MAAKPKNKGGRPSKKDTIDLERVKKLAIAGLTQEQIAIACDVGYSTLKAYMKEDKRFLAAIKTNDKLANKLMEASLWERGRGYSHPDVHICQHQGQVIQTPITKYYPPDTAAAFIWLKNRDPERWRDKTETAISLHIPDVTIRRDSE